MRLLAAIFRTTAVATATAFILQILGVCVLPLLALVLARFDAPFGHKTVESILTISPVAAALSASLTPGFTSYRLLPANWQVVGGLSLVLLLFLWIRTRQLYPTGMRPGRRQP